MVYTGLGSKILNLRDPLVAEKIFLTPLMHPWLSVILVKVSQSLYLGYSTRWKQLSDLLAEVKQLNC